MKNIVYVYATFFFSFLLCINPCQVYGAMEALCVEWFTAAIFPILSKQKHWQRVIYLNGRRFRPTFLVMLNCTPRKAVQ